MNMKTMLEALMASRQKGATLKELGIEHGVSRERIRQILKKHYGTTAIQNLHSEAEAEAARRLKCSLHTVESLRKRGYTHPQRRGWHWLYSEEDIEQVKSLLDKQCPMCGRRISPFHRACGECWQTNHYKLMTDKQKQAHHISVRCWRETHPERAKEIQRRAQLKRDWKIRKNK